MSAVTDGLEKLMDNAPATPVDQKRVDWSELAYPHQYGRPLIGPAVSDPLKELGFDSVRDLSELGLTFQEAWPRKMRAELLKVLNSNAFLCLGGIGQMHSAYTSTGAGQINSRLFHSLFVAEKVFESCAAINRNALERGDPFLQLSEDEIRTAVLAGLIHDIPHGPFSHAFEKIYSSLNRSETFDHDSLHGQVVAGDADLKAGLCGSLTEPEASADQIVDVLRSKRHPLHFLVKTLGDRLAYLAADSFSNVLGREELEWVRFHERSEKLKQNGKSQFARSDSEFSLLEKDRWLLSATSPDELAQLLDDIDTVVESLALVRHGNSSTIAVGAPAALRRVFDHREKVYSGNCISAEAQLVVAVLGRALRQAADRNADPNYAESLAQMSDREFLIELGGQVEPELRLDDWFAPENYLDDFFSKAFTYYLDDPAFQANSSHLLNSDFRKQLRRHLAEEFEISQDQTYVTFPFDDDRMAFKFNSVGRAADSGDWSIEVQDFTYRILDRYKEFTVWVAADASASLAELNSSINAFIKDYVAGQC